MPETSQVFAEAGQTGAEAGGWEQFLSVFLVVDWVNAGMLLVAAFTLFFTARAFCLQARAMDFSSYLDLMSRFSDAWRRLRGEKDQDQRDYEFAEILNLIEASCHLSRRSVLGRASREMMREYLKEIIGAIAQDKYGKSYLHKAISGPETFFEIKKFARKHNICLSQVEPESADTNDRG